MKKVTTVKKHPKKPPCDITVLCVFSPDLYRAIIGYVERRRQSDPGVVFSIRSAIRSLVRKGLQVEEGKL